MKKHRTYIFLHILKAIFLKYSQTHPISVVIVTLFNFPPLGTLNPLLAILAL